MKKLTFFLLFVCMFVISSCRLDSISKIDSGVKVIDKCYKTISSEGSKAGCLFIEIEERKLNPSNDASTLLPSYSWDAKQMIW